MKYLLVLIVVGFAVWLWRKNREAERIDQQSKPHQSPAPTTKASPATSSPQVMITCAHCGVHFPQTDLVRGARGAYCSTGHLALAEPKSKV